LSELSEVDIKNMPWDRDGCGLPAFALPLRALALAFSKFSRKGNVSEKRFAAMNAISNAMRKHPDMVAGRSRCCTATMEATDMLLVKTGAEGVFGGVCLSRGILDDSGYEAMEQVYQPAIKNSQGVVVGKVAASSVWGEL